ncbi:unnamed protein product, partial [Allacma fusca]
MGPRKLFFCFTCLFTYPFCNGFMIQPNPGSLFAISNRIEEYMSSDSDSIETYKVAQYQPRHVHLAYT